MSTKKNRGVKIKWLRIVDYKGIDELKIEFNRPKMPGEPYVSVMGSRNGLGKTSVLECCALLLMGLDIGLFRPEVKYNISIPGNFAEMIIRAGALVSQLEGEVIGGDMAITLNVEIDKSGGVKVNHNLKGPPRVRGTRNLESGIKDQFVSTVRGMNPNPLLSENFLYFHSYRKILEGNLELGMMIEKDNTRRQRLPVEREELISTFKLQILRSMMSQAKLFEESGDDQSEDILAKLNELVKRYAGGTIGKLRPSSDNKVDLRVQPIDGGPSFTFDGLSSGQKEIIATFFLVWYQTRNKPGVVLIDEPELHLNSEWHRDFVRQLYKIAPDNQYIIATHSEDVFASVNKDCRFLLQGSAGDKA